MKMRIGYTTPWLALAFMLSGVYSAHGQSPLSDPNYARPSVGTPIGLSGPPQIPLSGSTGLRNHTIHITENPDPIAKSFRQSGEKLAYLKPKLIEALTLKDEKFIADVKGEVKDALNEHFAHDLAIRESVLMRLTKRADNAESQNKQRHTSRDELIELQLQSYMMEKDAPATGSSDLDLESQSLFGSRRASRPDDVSFAGTPGLLRSTSIEPITANPIFRAAGDSPAAERRPANPRMDDDLADPTFDSGRRLQQDSTAAIKEARMKLARAASVDEETQAAKELKEALSVYFLRDLEERDRLLKTVRADLEKMKQKLEKRANSKNSIVELQFKMFVNEASGLGFFSPQVTTDRFDEAPGLDDRPLSDLLSPKG